MNIRKVLKYYLCKTIFLFICFFLSRIISWSQVIPASQTTNWNIAGLDVTSEPNNSPAIQTLSQTSIYRVYDFVQDFNGDYTGVRDNAGILARIFKEVSPPARIKFPSGIYLFNRPIRVPSGFVLQGTSPNTTHFLFDLKGKQNSLFQVIGSGPLSEPVQVTNAGTQGGTTIKVEDGRTFSSGDDLELDQENPARIFFSGSHNTEWARRSLGQMLKVKSRNGNTIELDRTLTLDYDVNLDLKVARVGVTEEVGFEAFSIKRLDNGLGSNFLFDYAANCWISCVRSSMATRYHVEMRRSRNCLIKGSYFQDAQFHCGGGAGYGVMLRKHTTESAVYNNIFTKLRHSIMVKEGANRNVISYNYSNEVTTSDGNVRNKRCVNKRIVDFPDISVHGHYSYMNLFEHNVVQAVHSADNWGPSGPGTTFFRNLVESDYGIKVSMASEGQNIIGNVSSSIDIDSTVTNTVRIRNRVNNRIDFILGKKLPSSMYLADTPDFYGDNFWPSIDPSFGLNMNTNPAKKRWARGLAFDKYCCGDVPGLESVVIHKEDFVIFYEESKIIVEHIPSGTFDLTLVDMQGRILKEVVNFDPEEPLYLENPLHNGVYILQLNSNKRKMQAKIVVS